LIDVYIPFVFSAIKLKILLNYEFPLSISIQQD